jgi:tetratricopeptide (TPR) repeat protein
MTSPSDNGSSDGAGQKARTTLRPPEWTQSREGPRSAASLTFEIQLSDAPVSRRTGPRAELAFLAARVRTCSSAGDMDGERTAATALARALVTRGTELDSATKLARRALLLGHDAALREELSGWFAALGEPALAAATLRPLVADLSGAAAARILTRIGVLLGRAGDAAGAADALFDAAREDPADPAAPELQAGIGAWAESAVSSERAAEGYLEGFRRREASGDRAAAFEDLLRAFEMAPGEPLPAERLAGALAVRGRTGAADEVLREHARASGDRGRAVHLRGCARRFADDVLRAIGAAFDAVWKRSGPGGARVEGTSELDDSPCGSAPQPAPLAGSSSFHACRERAGVGGALLARTRGRWLTRPRHQPGSRRWSWTPARAMRAMLMNEFWCNGRRGAARERVCAREGSRSERCPLADLTELGATRLGLPGRAVWAGKAAHALGDDPKLAEHVARALPAAQEEEARIDALRHELRSGGDPAATLAELAGLFRGRPERVDEYVEVLRSPLICRVSPLVAAHVGVVLTHEGREDSLSPRKHAWARAGRGPRAVAMRLPCTGRAG